MLRLGIPPAFRPTAFDFVPSAPWRCPACGAVQFTRDRGPRCPMCGYWQDE